MTKSVFAATADALFTRYEVEMTFLDKLMAGTPSDPKVVEGWLAKKAGITSEQDELRIVVVRTLRELGVDAPEDATMDDLAAAMDEIAGAKHTCVFKRDEHGLYVDSRQVKAMIKESTNILFGKDNWGPTKKRARGFTAERAFPAELRIHLERQEPDGVELFIGHVMDKEGPKSTLTHYEYVLRPRLNFTLEVTYDALKQEHWAMIWTHAERNGFGALRSQGHGTFRVTKWEQLPA